MGMAMHICARCIGTDDKDVSVLWYHCTFICISVFNVVTFALLPAEHILSKTNHQEMTQLHAPCTPADSDVFGVLY